MSEHHPLDDETPGGLDRARARVEFRLDPKIRAVSEELDAINKELAKLSVDSLPKILQIKVGKREYTSIRRIESAGITRTEISGEDPFWQITDYKVREDLVGEGAVGAMLLPDLVYGEAKGRDLVEFLESQEDIESLHGWGTSLPVAIDRGIPFKLNEWRFGMPYFATVKRVKGELYGQRVLPIFTRTKGRYIGVARRVIPDREGMITFRIPHFVEKEADIQRELDQRFATFYVLVEGKSEQERQEEPGGARKLEPRLSEVIN